MNLNKFLLLPFFLLGALHGSSQTDEERLQESQTQDKKFHEFHSHIGKKMPDFTFENLQHFKISRASLKDFKGKWLFLDFWSTGCSSCIRHFPIINNWQEKFKDSMQFVLVGLNSVSAMGSGIEHLYEKFQNKENLQMAIAYDSNLFYNMGVQLVPLYVIIDPAGILRVITNGTDMTDGKLEDLMAGKEVSFDRDNLERSDWNPGRITDSSDQIIYRSVLSKWNGEKDERPDLYRYVALYKDNGFRSTMTYLEQLYILAYTGYTDIGFDGLPLYGNTFPHLVLETKDTDVFAYNYKSVVGIYNYDLTIKSGKRDPVKIMHIVQDELKNIFGYSVTIESRAMPVWQLVSAPGARDKLKTKGSAYYYSDSTNSGGSAGFTARNLKMSNFLHQITYYTDDYKFPYFDETGIQENIDITMDALLTDRDAVIKELKRNGLDLVMGTKQLKVIVVKDPEN